MLLKFLIFKEEVDLFLRANNKLKDISIILNKLLTSIYNTIS